MFEHEHLSGLNDHVGNKQKLLNFVFVNFNNKMHFDTVQDATSHTAL